MARITEKLHPRARRTRIAGRLGEAYKFDVAAPPVEGQANEECIRLMAELAGVARSRVRIVTGLTGRTKVIEVEDLEQSELERLLDAGLSAPQGLKS